MSPFDSPFDFTFLVPPAMLVRRPPQPSGQRPPGGRGCPSQVCVPGGGLHDAGGDPKVRRKTTQTIQKRLGRPVGVFSRYTHIDGTT